MTGSNKESKEFQNNILGYNSALAFTSLGVSLDKRFSNMKNSGHYTFRIHGTICHRIGSLIPSKNQDPCFLQLYFYDTEHELQNRHNNFPNLDVKILENLQTLMHKLNPFISKFKQFGNEIKNQSNMQIVIKDDSSVDWRTSNKPTCSEVGVVLPGRHIYFII